MDSQMDSTIRGGASSMSKPTEARSSALANKGEGGADKKKGVRDGLSTVIEFFETFMGTVKTQFGSRGAGSDPMINALESNFGDMKNTFEQINNSLEDYDEKLIGVLGQHQDDFWFAFKTHMNKIEKELAVLQAKSKDQDAKLTQDVRIINLEQQLKWYQNEFENLTVVKSKNDEQIIHLKDQCKNLGQNSDEMRDCVKAAKRQNKLLGVALQKAKEHKEELEGLGDDIQTQTHNLKRNTVQMPDLMFSPFLPISQQIDQQKQLDFMSQADYGNPGYTLDVNNYRQGVAPDESFMRLNSDLPSMPLYPDETIAAAANLQPEGIATGTSNSKEVLSASGSLSPTNMTGQPPIVQVIQPGGASPTNAQAAGAAQIPANLYDSGELNGSEQHRMESIPEEEASKANLHSSHSKVGVMHNNASQPSASHPANFLRPSGNLKLSSFAQFPLPESTVLQQYVKDLVSAGKTEAEIVDDLEMYYDTLVRSCDNEIIDLKEELELEKAGHREQAADEVYLKANEIDELSNIFIDCIHAHRKTLRQQLVKMKFKESQGQNDDYQFDVSRSSLQNPMGSQRNKKTNLLQTYLRIVKTGAPEEIEKFSQIERQKLVELLVTNQELLNFMFDKMFKNNYDPKEREQMLLSKMTLSETAFDPGSLEQLYADDPLELLQRSTELRRAHEQSQTGTKYHRMLKPVGSTGASRTQANKMPNFYSQTKTQTHGPRQPDQQLNMQKLMLDRKQRSMAIGVGRSGVIDEITASPLLLQQNAKGERQTLRGYDSLNEAQQLHGSLKQTEKVASDFGKNVFHHLSNVDTDKMQTQFLSNTQVEQAKPSQKSINLPAINKPGPEMYQGSEVPSPQNINTGHSSKGYMTAQTHPSQRTQMQMAPMTGRSKKNLLQGKSQRQLRAMSNRPLIHIRDGKLLLSGPQQHSLTAKQR